MIRFCFKSFIIYITSISLLIIFYCDYLKHYITIPEKDILYDSICPSNYFIFICSFLDKIKYLNPSFFLLNVILFLYSNIFLYSFFFILFIVNI